MTYVLVTNLLLPYLEKDIFIKKSTIDIFFIIVIL